MMEVRQVRWVGFVVGVALFAVGTVIVAQPKLGLLPDFLMYIGGCTLTWMAAKLFWTDDPPEWFFFLLAVGWVIIVAMTMNLIGRGIVL